MEYNYLMGLSVVVLEEWFLLYWYLQMTDLPFFRFYIVTHLLKMRIL